MKKILSVESPEGHYHAKSVILWCFDDRFSGVLEKFLKEHPDQHFDVIKVAGGVKQLVSPEHETDRDFILRQIAASIKLHGAENVGIMAHDECGAYGGKREVPFYEEELKKGEEVLKEFLHIGVTKMFVGFDGIYEI